MQFADNPNSCRVETGKDVHATKFSAFKHDRRGGNTETLSGGLKSLQTRIHDSLCVATGNVVAMQHVRRITGVIYLAFVFQIQTDSHFLVCCCSAYIFLSLALRGSYRPLDQRVLLPSK